MVKKAADYRAQARAALSGRWATAVFTSFLLALAAYSSYGGATVLYGLTSALSTLGDSNFNISFFLKFTSSQMGLQLLYTLYNLAVVFILSFMNLGENRFYLGLVRGETVGVSALVSRFKIAWKAFGLLYFMQLLIGLWAYAFIFPGYFILIIVMLTALALGYTSSALIIPVTIVFGLFALMGLAAAIIAALRYSAAAYIMAEYPSVGIRDAVRRSKRLMRGNLLRFARLQLSFMGWWLLSLLTLGIGFLWYAPYFRTSCAAFFDDLFRSAQADITARK